MTSTKLYNDAVSRLENFGNPSQVQNLAYELELDEIDKTGEEIKEEEINEEETNDEEETNQTALEEIICNLPDNSVGDEI